MTKGLTFHLLAFLFPLLAVMPIISCSIPSPAAISEEQAEDRWISTLYSQVAMPTYRVSAALADGREWSGSAVALTKRYLVTAAHVALDDEGVPVEKLYITNGLGSPKYVSTARVVKFSRPHDLAILEVPVSLPYVADFFTRPEINNTTGWGSRVWASGYSLGVDEQVVTDGRITSTNDSNFIRYSAPTLPGNSGGPVFARLNGRFAVLSISQAGYVRGGPIAHMGLGVNPYTLMDFIGEYR